MQISSSRVFCLTSAVLSLLACGATSAATFPDVSQLLNISTRASVQTNDKVLIGGFIITGSDPKTVVLRALGPSLANAGLSGLLADPTIELHDASGATIASNDNWQTSSGAGQIAANELAPTNTNEAALLQTLMPGSYTAIVRGAGGASGIGLIEVYDLSSSPSSRLVNISTRGFAGTGDNVMIGGFILGSGTAPVVVRALGPSLTASNVAGALANPILTLVDSNGAVVASNDDWQQDSNAAAIESANLAPPSSSEAATMQTLTPGDYTVLVRGAANSTGVALVEVYNLN